MRRSNVALLALAWLAPSFALGASTAPPAVVTQGGAKGAAPCAACHGADGAGRAEGGFPRLAGLDESYLVKQLQDFRGGLRANAVMGAQAALLSPEEMQAASAFYARQTPPAAGAASAEGAGAGERIATHGLWQKEVPACLQCHGRRGQGIGRHFPALAGQHASYLSAQIRAWQDGSRKNDPSGLMAAVARRLSPDETAAVAAYFAGLGGVKMSDSAAPRERPAVPAPPPTRSESPAESRSAPAAPTNFVPPPRDAIPPGPFGAAVEHGYLVFTQTSTYAKEFVGNGLQCSNCHLDAGRLANSAPLWAAWVAYPAYRKKDDKVNTMEDRLLGCFRYSMNAPASPSGDVPPKGHAVLVDLQAYMYWLATGAPTGIDLPGRAYPELPLPKGGHDPARGKLVYERSCSICHGSDGAGTKEGEVYAFPPLWGPASFNWGAGMHRTNTAAAFIHANMPLGMPRSLSEQDAWDVAAYVTSRDRPADPRAKGSTVKDAAARHHAGERCYYGGEVDKEVRGD